MDPFCIKREISYPDLKELYLDPKAWLAKAGENADLYRLNLKFKKIPGRMARRERPS